MGRPTKLTPELSAKICEYVRIGLHVDTAAAYVGIAEKTFYRWMERGRSAKRGIYADFVEDLRRAEAQMTAAMVLGHRKAMTTDWRAPLTFLARRQPKRWGPNAQPPEPLATTEAASSKPGGVVFYLPEEERAPTNQTATSSTKSSEEAPE
jgi:hypothetical protein